MTERIVDQPLRCITYSRVSTKGQVERGFSLEPQGEATWAHAEAKGYEIEARRVFGRGPGEARYRPRAGFGGGGRHRPRAGAGVRALRMRDSRLDDDGDRSPKGDLVRGVKSQVAKYERAKIN